MDQQALLQALLQGGGGARQLMMNPAPALAGLPGGGQINAPMQPQQAPPNPLMAPPTPAPQMGMQHPMMPSAPPQMSAPQQSGGNPIAQGLASLGSPLGQLMGKPGETPTATNTLLQMLMGHGAQGGIGGLLSLLK